MPQSLEELLGFKGIGLEESILFRFGKKAKSPFEEPSIVRPSKISSYYERLVLENFTNDENGIKKAYRAQAFIWHPDRNHGYKREAENEFIALDEAYQTLINPARKAIYDQKLRQELEQNEKPNGWQSTQRNAQRAARAARSFVTLQYIDSWLSPEQKAKVDYLDFLIDSGQISLTGFGDVYMANWEKACDYCHEGKLSRSATISYKNNSMGLHETYAHSLLAHGARAVIAAILKDSPPHDRFQSAYSVVNIIYQRLNIDLPTNALKGNYYLPAAKPLA